MTDASRLEVQHLPPIDPELLRLPAPKTAEPVRAEWSRRFDFGMKDQRGRRIGMLAATCKRGDVYVVRCQVTRNGRVFGAATRGVEVDSAEAATMEVQRRVEQAVKRYAKKANLAAEGIHERWVSRETGFELTIQDAADFEVDPTAGRYFLICEEHGTCVGLASKAVGRSMSGLDFCYECRAVKED